MAQVEDERTDGLDLTGVPICTYKYLSMGVIRADDKCDPLELALLEGETTQSGVERLIGVAVLGGIELLVETMLQEGDSEADELVGETILARDTQVLLTGFELTPTEAGNRADALVGETAVAILAEDTCKYLVALILTPPE